MSKQKVQSKGRTRREQPRKDSRRKRVNYDNTRESKFEKDMERETHKGGTANDVSWYAKNPELLKASASLPFSVYAGQPLPYEGSTITVSVPKSDGSAFEGVSAVANTVPGIMTLNWTPTIGGAFNDAINQAARSTYSFVVHANSRSKTYDAPDLMQIILCGASLFAEIGKGIRAYGLMRTFFQENRYTPQALLAATGFNYEDLQSNLSHMWFDLNELIARTQQIWIPNTFPFIERWFWLNSNVYTDAQSSKAQYYIFNSYAYLKYSETGDFADDNHLAEAEYKVAICSSPTSGRFLPGTSYNDVAGAITKPTGTWADYMSKVNDMFEALLNSQDRGIIMGDILKAYGADKIYALKPIPADYQVIPVYEPEVLWQIENATVFDATGWEAISQDPKTGDLYTSAYTPTSGTVQYGYHQGSTVPPMTQVLNFHQKEQPTPDQIMEATRLKALGCVGIPNGKNGALGYRGTQYGGLAPATCGTEVVTGITVTLMGTEQFTGVALRGVVDANYDSEYGIANRAYNSLFTLWDLVSAFDWSPFIYNVKWTRPWGTSTTVPLAYGTETQSVVYNAIGDYDMWTTIDQ